MRTHRSKKKRVLLTTAETAARLLVPERILGLYVTDGLLTAYYEHGEIRFLAREVDLIAARLRAAAFLAAGGHLARLRARAASDSDRAALEPTSPPRRWPRRKSA